MRWVTGWNSGKKPGVGMRDSFLRSLGLSREDSEVLEFYKNRQRTEEHVVALPRSSLDSNLMANHELRNSEDLQSDHEM